MFQARLMEENEAYLDTECLHCILDILGEEGTTLGVNHKLLGLLQDEVETVLDIAGEDFGGAGAEGVDREGDSDFLNSRKGPLWLWKANEGNKVKRTTDGDAVGGVDTHDLRSWHRARS